MRWLERYLDEFAEPGRLCDYGRELRAGDHRGQPPGDRPGLRRTHGQEEARAAGARRSGHRPGARGAVIPRNLRDGSCQTASCTRLNPQPHMARRSRWCERVWRPIEPKTGPSYAGSFTLKRRSESLRAAGRRMIPRRPSRRWPLPTQTSCITRMYRAHASWMSTPSSSRVRCAIAPRTEASTTSNEAGSTWSSTVASTDHRCSRPQTMRKQRTQRMAVIWASTTHRSSTPIRASQTLLKRESSLTTPQ